MKATDDVFVLIKTLTKSEKRYFKLFATKQGSEEQSEYLQLFDLLDAMEEHDEEAIREAIGREKARYLPQMKYYLYRNILRALNQFHASTNVEAQINELLQAYDILYDKRLFGQCRKILGKARKLAIRADSGLHLMRVLIFEYHLAVLEPDSSKAREEVAAIFDELVSAGERTALRYRYWRIQSQMFIATKFSVGDAGDGALARELLNDPLMLADPPEGDPFATLLYLFTHHHHALATSDQEGAYYWGKKIVELVEAEPGFRERIVERYIPALHNLCMAMVETRRFEEFDREYRKLAALAARAIETNPRFNDLHIRMLEPRAEMDQGNFQKAATLLEALEEPFRSTRETLRIGFGIYFNYVFAYSYFGAGCHRRALVWLGNILNDKNVNTHEHIHCYARILNLMVHYELGNFTNLEFFAASAARFLSRRNKMHRVESIAIEMFRRLLSAADAATSRRIFSEALGKLRDAERLAPDTFASLDLIGWIESKLSGESFGERAHVRRMVPPMAVHHDLDTRAALYA